MISYLKGTVLYTGINYIILQCNNIGYKIFTTPNILESARNGRELEIYTYFKISENEQTLYGLEDIDTLHFFELLITVTSVGPKMALTILSAAKKDILETAIANNDVEIFTHMSGVGKKTAERIILELKNKVGSIPGIITQTNNDIYNALVSLGYSSKEARAVIPHIDTTTSNEQQLKQALQLLSKT